MLLLLLWPLAAALADPMRLPPLAGLVLILGTLPMVRHFTVLWWVSRSYYVLLPH